MTLTEAYALLALASLFPHLVKAEWLNFARYTVRTIGTVAA